MSPDAAFFDGHGKTVFVSGGTSGINRGIARRFAEAGASVFVISRSADTVLDTLDELRGLGVQADGVAADVRDAAAVDGAFGKCAERFGKIDILISGAAGNFPALARNISSNGFRAVLEIDVLGTHHVMLAGYRRLHRPGVVLNISAAASFRAMIGQVHVCAAKAAVDQITRTLALEWGPEGIRVNSVVPGPVADTEGFKRLAPTPEAIEKRVASIPLRRAARSEEVADLCLFLASERAAYITGAVIPVDGGAMLGAPADILVPVLDASAPS